MVIKMNKILNFKGDHEGLDSQTAKENLRVYGFNSEIKQEEKRKFKFYGVFKNLRIYLMLSAAALYFVSGFSAEGGLLLFLALGFCTFEILVENYCTQKLSEITDSAVVITRVVRDGEIALVKREEIVQDDLIVLQGGENVPADAHILESSNVTVDESVFGGSANPVKKHPGSDGRHELKQSCVYKGTKVLTGVLIARVFATGQDVKLRPEIRTVKEINRTQIETTVNKLSVLFTYGAGILLVVVAVARFMMAGNAEPEEGITVLGYLAGIILPAISFTLCAVPVSLALIIRIYYVNGATKLSEDYSGIKSLRTVETLKAVTAVCLDIDSIIVADDTPIVEEISKNKEMLIRVAALSCKTDEPVPSNSYEKAILVGASFRHINTDELYKNTLLRPYVPELESDYNKINGNLWEINGAHLLCVKGTPEVILSFCKLPPEQLYPIQQKQSEYAKQGYHVFAVAFAKIEDDCYEEDDEDGNGDESETAKSLIPDTLFDVEYTFLGLIVFSATIRENIPEVVKSCYSVGINVVMLSPDSERSGGRETALTIARKAGISQDGVIAGKKEEVVESLKSAGEVVALFGTSSNDIKALEAADISVALSKYTTPRDWDSGAGGLSELTTGSACEACELVLKS
ncbi:MAG: HAD family hydrolase, partial [Oscillospiraceae bacterium]|nr:HAD family hydrolase [Oscillospiraceae bacterium]